MPKYSNRVYKRKRYRRRALSRMRYNRMKRASVPRTKSVTLWRKRFKRRFRKMSTRGLVKYVMRTRPKHEVKILEQEVVDYDDASPAVGDFETKSHYAYDGWLSLAQGTAQDQRVGSKIYVKYLRVKLHIFLNPLLSTGAAAFASSTAWENVTVLFGIIPDMPRADAISAILPTSIFAFTAPASFSRYTRKDDDTFAQRYKLLYRKSFPMQMCKTIHDTTGQATYWSPCKNWRIMDIKIPLNRVFEYERNITGASKPQDRLFMWVGIDSLNQAMSPSVPHCSLDYFSYEIGYSDA